MYAYMLNAKTSLFSRTMYAFQKAIYSSININTTLKVRGSRVTCYKVFRSRVTRGDLFLSLVPFVQYFNLSHKLEGKTQLSDHGILFFTWP